jgi:hypothetical protein
MKPNRKSVLTTFALSFMAVWVALTVFAVTWGSEFDWPDYLHVDYGFPLVWATHILSTIVGPVDIWKINPQALIIDLVLWLGSMVIAIAAILYSFDRKAEN